MKALLFFCEIVYFLEYLVLSAPTKTLTTELNDYPIIGIVAQELNFKLGTNYPAYTSFIAASYVKAVESSGARVVPIIPHRDEAYYRKLLNSINGVVFPGGSSGNKPGKPYYDSVAQIYKIATEMNNNGIRFPILGVCLGFEFLITVANENKNILMNCSIDNKNYPLKFTKNYLKTALFSELTPQQYNILTSENVTFNHHTWCALPDTFNKTPLKDQWIVTSTSTSSEGLTFIASVEHKIYPFFGIQFHPEKIAFEWFEFQGVPHSKNALIANRYFYDFIVEYSKMNTNVFNDSEVYAWLIDNYPVTYSVHLDSYMQIYLF